MAHVILQPDAGQDVVVIHKQHGLGVALPHPPRHLERDVLAEPLLVVVAMDHLVVQIVFGEAAAVTAADVPRPARASPAIHRLT